MPRKINKSHGFTLLEVLVAMMILLVGVLSAAGLHIFVARNNTSGNVSTQAVLLAQSRIDQIKNAGDISTLNGDFGTESNIVPLDGNLQPIEGGGVYTIDYRFCDPINDIIDIPGTGAAYTPPTDFQGNMCDPAVDAADFADCGSAPLCTNVASGTCLTAVRVTWTRGGGGRGGRGCVVLQTLTQGRGI